MCYSFNNFSRLFAFGCLIVCVVIFSGCSTVQSSPNSLRKNMQVFTKISSDSAAADTVVEFDIHRVNSNCELQNEGRIFLGNGKFDVGISNDELYYLDFIFTSKRMLLGSENSARYGTMLKPRPGYSYLARVTYLDGINSVLILESSDVGSDRRELERIPLSECRARQ